MTPTTTTETPTLAIGKIAAHPRNPRRDVGDVTELAASVEAKGILQPLVVAPWPTDTDAKKPRGAEHVLIAGHRRLAAAKQAGLKHVPVVVRDDLDTIAAQLEAMLVENLQRADLTPVEEAHAYQELLDFKIPVKTIAASTGQKQTRVRERLKLTKLPAAIQDLTHAGQISLGDAMAFDEFKDDTEVLEQLTEAAGTTNFAHTLERARAAKRADEVFAARVSRLEEAGVRILNQDDLNELGGGTYRSLGNYLPGVTYVYEWHSEADETAALHADCPGHAALPLPESRIVRYYCLTPDVHDDRPAAEVRGDDRETSLEELEVRRQEEERAAAKERDRLDRQAAHATRRDWVGQIINAGPSDDVARDFLLRVILAEEDEGPSSPAADHEICTDVASMLGIAYDAASIEALPYIEQHPARVDLLRPALEKLSLPQLTVLLEWLWRDWPERELVQAWTNPWASGTVGRDWLDRLVDVYGYQLSDYEAGQIAAADTESGDDQ